MKRTIRRGIAATALAGAALLAAAGTANADTMVYQGVADGGGYTYYNVNTGVTIVSADYRGATFDTCDEVR